MTLIGIDLKNRESYNYGKSKTVKSVTGVNTSFFNLQMLLKDTNVSGSHSQEPEKRLFEEEKETHAKDEDCVFQEIFNQAKAAGRNLF